MEPAPVTAPPPAAVAPPPEAKPAPAPDPAEAAKAEQIRLRGIEIRKQRNEAQAKLAAERDQLRAERDAKAKELADLSTWKKRLAADPEVLRDVYGEKWYETLTKAKLGDDSNLQVRQLREEFEAKFAEQQKTLDAERESRQKELAAQAENAKRAEAKAQAEFARDAGEYVKANPEKHETILALAAQGSIVAIAEREYKRTGVVLSEEKAAELTEKELDDAILKVIGTKKWKAKLAALTPPVPTTTERWAQRRSIGNDMAPSPAAPVADERLTKQQKLARLTERLARERAEAELNGRT